MIAGQQRSRRTDHLLCSLRQVHGQTSCESIRRWLDILGGRYGQLLGFYTAATPAAELTLIAICAPLRTGCGIGALASILCNNASSHSTPNTSSSSSSR